MRRKADSAEYRDLPTEPEERYEMIMDFFGQDLMSLRKNAMVRVLGELDRENWEHLLPYDAKFFEDAAQSLDEHQREVAKKLAERFLNEFMQGLMTMITCEGRNNPMGRDHGLDYQLHVQIRHYPKDDSPPGCAQPEATTAEDEDDPIDSFVPVDDAPEPVDTYGAIREEHDLTKGQIHFPNYWHRWLRRFKDY